MEKNVMKNNEVGKNAITSKMNQDVASEGIMKGTKPAISCVFMGKANDFAQLVDMQLSQGETEKVALVFQNFMKSDNTIKDVLVWMKQVADKTQSKEKLIAAAEMFSDSRVVDCILKFDDSELAFNIGKQVYLAVGTNGREKLIWNTLDQISMVSTSEAAVKIAKFNTCFAQAQNSMSITDWEFSDSQVGYVASLLQKLDDTPNLGAAMMIHLAVFAKISKDKLEYLETAARMDNEIVVNCIKKFNNESRENASQLAKGLTGIAAFARDKQAVINAAEKIANEAKTSSEAVEMAGQMLNKLQDEL